MTSALLMLRCAQLGLSDETLRTMDLGMIYDLLTEQANDAEEYPIKGTSEDFRRIFGD